MGNLLHEKRQFPSIDVVPVTVDDMSQIQTYSLTEKADGEHCLLLVSASGFLYLIFNQGAGLIQIKKTGYYTTTEKLLNSLFDGELVNIKEQLNQIYLMFDCFICNGEEMRNHMLADPTQKSSKTRYACVEQMDQAQVFDSFIEEGLATMRFQRKIYRYPSKEKPFTQVAKTILKETYPYNLDGLIFTDYHRPYQYLRDQPLNWKWKPLNKLSIDFWVELVHQPVQVGQEKFLKALLKVKPKDLEIRSANAFVNFEPEQELNYVMLEVGNESVSLPRSVDHELIYDQQCR